MRAANFKIDHMFHDRFAMITRGFVEEFSLRMSRNAWVLYLALATFYNREQQRAFPTAEMLFAVVPLTRSSRSRALRELLDLQLVEVWGQRQRRRRRTFYRLLHVDRQGHHLMQAQQPTCDQLQAWKAEGALPRDFEWVRQAYLKSEKRVSVCR